jgi:hypothetical protein
MFFMESESAPLSQGGGPGGMHRTRFLERKKKEKSKTGGKDRRDISISLSLRSFQLYSLRCFAGCTSLALTYRDPIEESGVEIDAYRSKVGMYRCAGVLMAQAENDPEGQARMAGSRRTMPISIPGPAVLLFGTMPRRLIGTSPNIIMRIHARRGVNFSRTPERDPLRSLTDRTGLSSSTPICFTKPTGSCSRKVISTVGSTSR